MISSSFGIGERFETIPQMRFLKKFRNLLTERGEVFQSLQNLFLTNRGNAIMLYLISLKGGEVDEMDVSARNPLFDLRLDAQVLSKTLNCSTEKFRNFKGR